VALALLEAISFDICQKKYPDQAVPKPPIVKHDLIYQKGKIGEIYKIASGNERTNLEITHSILNELNKPKNLIKFVEDRPGHDFRYSLNREKIKKLEVGKI